MGMIRTPWAALTWITLHIGCNAPEAVPKPERIVPRVAERASVRLGESFHPLAKTGTSLVSAAVARALVQVADTPANPPSLTLDWVTPLGGQAHAKDLPNGEAWYVNLDLTKVTDEQLESLSGEPEIVAISLAKTAITDRGLRQLTSLRRLSTLNLFATQITDAGLAEISEVSSLQTLLLQQTKVSDAGLISLLSLGELRVLVLDEALVTDEGMVLIAALPQLTHVSLRNTKLTDAGLLALGQSPTLEVIIVTGTSVTPEGVNRLRWARPALQIVQ